MYVCMYACTHTEYDGITNLPSLPCYLIHC